MVPPADLAQRPHSRDSASYSCEREQTRWTAGQRLRVETSMPRMPIFTTRRDVLRGSALLAAGLAAPAALSQATSNRRSLPPSPVRLGIASYSLRNFDQAYVISAMKQLRTPYLNLKDVHLPMMPLD